MSDLQQVPTSSHQLPSVDEFIAAFGELGLISEEIADVIWLALEIQQYEQLFSPTKDSLRESKSGKSDKLSGSPIDSSKPIEPSTPSATSPTPSPSDSLRQAEIHASEEQPGEKSASGSRDLAIRLPDARSLQEPLSLARALRPLFRRVPSANMVLDEAATIERIAEEQLWTPVLKPDLEPWLDLALVVDESKSMLLWQRTIRELQRVLERYGIFRDVRTWGMVIDQVTNKDGQVHEQVCIRPGIGKAARNQRTHSPAELIDPQGRRLVLIATDCVAAHWHDGTVLSVLRTWSQSGSTAIIQMLPEWLWSRTALGLAAPVRFRALFPGLPSQHLQAKPLSAWDEIDFETGIQVPIVTLEPEIFTIWSQLVAGKGGVWAPGFVFEPELFEPNEEAEEENSSDNGLSAEQQVRKFYNSASPMAWKLASLLAAAPIINLPVVRIIQNELLPKSRQVHVAEVFLGGLVRPSQPLFEITPDTNPDTIRYDFVEGVREVLLESSLRSDSVDVLMVVSQFVDSRLGRSLAEFVAYLRDPNQIRDGEIQSNPIAMVTAQILKQLGGEYARYAEQLEGVDKLPRDEEPALPDESVVQEQREVLLTLEKEVLLKLEKEALLWQQGNTEQQSINHHQSQINCVIFSPNKPLIASADHNGNICFSSFNGDLISTFKESQNKIWSIAFSTDGKLLVSGTDNGNINLWEISKNGLLRTWDTTQTVYSVAYHPSLEVIASVGHSQKIDIHSIDVDGISTSILKAHQGVISSVSFNLDGKLLASCSDDHTIKIWNWETKELIRTLEGHRGWVNAIAFHPNGDFIVSASSDKTVRLWSVDEGTSVKIYEGHTNEVSSVAFHPSGKIIASGSRDGTVRLWNLQGDLLGEPLIAHHPHVKTVAFSPDGKILASGGSDGIIKLWKRQGAERTDVEHKVPNTTEMASSSLVKKILIMTANPKDTFKLELDEEVAQIQESLENSRERTRFEIVSMQAVTVERFRRAMLDHNPQIVHFSGHGAGEEGLVFENEDGEAHFVNSALLSDLFRLFANQVECVVLNVGESEVQATAIAQHISYVVGMSQSIRDDAARKFAVGFYDALGAGRSIEDSYAFGCNAIALNGILAEDAIPVLKKKSDFINQQSLFEELRSVLAIVDEQERTETLAHLMARSPEVPSNLLHSLSTIENETDLVSALIALIPHLPSTLLSNALPIVRTIQNTVSRFQGFAALAALLPEVLPEALQAAQAIEFEEHRAEALTVLADQLPPDLLPKALEAAQAIEDVSYRAEALTALADKLPEALPKALEAAQAIESEFDRARALTALADKLPEALPKALEAAQAIEDVSYRARALTALADKLPEALPKALEAAQAIESEFDRARALTALADKLPEALPKALEAAQAIESEFDRARALTALADKLPPDLLPKALEAAQAIESEFDRARALTALADKAPDLLPQVNDLIEIAGCDNLDRRGDVIFVHGLGGHARGTWHPQERHDDDNFWPAWLGEDLKNVGVWSLGYELEPFGWKGNSMPMADRATNILDLLDSYGIGDRPLMFITHSLGGLLVKQMLRNARDYGKWSAIASQTKGIVFLSTPHSGSDMASWIQHIGGILRTTVSVEELEAHHTRFRELNLLYRNDEQFSQIPMLIYCETRSTHGILVVNQTTADPGIRGVIPIPMDFDHISICKVADRKSQIYRQIKRFIENELTTPLAPLPLKRAEGEAIPQALDGVAQEDNSQMTQKNYDNSRGWQSRGWQTKVDGGTVYFDVTLSATAIATLAFTKMLEKFTEDALTKMDELRQKIWNKLRGNPRAENALTAVEQGNKDELQRLAVYLEDAMEDDPQFANEVRALAQEINFGVTLSATAITTLAFTKMLEKFTEDALTKMDELRQKIWNKLRGNPRAENALTAVEQGNKDELQRLAVYLEDAMEDDPQFANEVRALAQEINFGVTLSATAITTLAFTKMLEKFTEDALTKMDELRQKIWNKLRGNPRAENALTAVEQGNKDELQRLAVYLEDAMEDDPQFANEARALAQEINAGKGLAGK